MAEHTAMVGRVAAVITAAFEKEGRVFDDGQAVALARAAIVAMREPTPDMVGAMKTSMQPEVSWDHPDAIAEFDMVLQGYVAMIGAALGESNG